MHERCCIHLNKSAINMNINLDSKKEETTTPLLDQSRTSPGHSLECNYQISEKISEVTAASNSDNTLLTVIRHVKKKGGRLKNDGLMEGEKPKKKKGKTLRLRSLMTQEQRDKLNAYQKRYLASRSEEQRKRFRDYRRRYYFEVLRERRKNKKMMEELLMTEEQREVKRAKSRKTLVSAYRQEETRVAQKEYDRFMKAVDLKNTSSHNMKRLSSILQNDGIDNTCKNCIETCECVYEVKRENHLKTYAKNTCKSIDSKKIFNGILDSDTEFLKINNPDEMNILSNSLNQKNGIKLYKVTETIKTEDKVQDILENSTEWVKPIKQEFMHEV